MKAQDAPPSSKARLRPRPPPDPSVLRPSIEISVTGMKQALACLENGTPEIRDYLLNECNVIYECKVCLNMFRSLANFISHKRSYCDSRAKEVFRMGDPEPESGSSHLYTTVAYIEPEPVDTLVPEPVWDLKDYSPSLNLLKEAGFLEEIQTLPHPMKKLKPNLASIVHSLKLKAKPQKAKPLPPAKKKPSLEPLKEPIVRLERITQTTCAMFQTVSTEQTILKTMGRAYVELEKLKKCPTVLMGPDGKIIQPDKKYNSLSSKESIKENMNTSHYHCPLCKLSLSKMNNVILHIHKVHGKSMKEALEYRSSIRNALHALDTFKGSSLGRRIKHSSIVSCSEKKSSHRKTTNSKRISSIEEEAPRAALGAEYSDEEVTFNPRYESSQGGPSCVLEPSGERVQPKSRSPTLINNSRKRSSRKEPSAKVKARKTKPQANNKRPKIGLNPSVKSKKRNNKRPKISLNPSVKSKKRKSLKRLYARKSLLRSYKDCSKVSKI